MSNFIPKLAINVQTRLLGLLYEPLGDCQGQGHAGQNKIMYFTGFGAHLFLCMGCGYVPWCPYEGQWVTIGSWFSSSVMWVLGIQLCSWSSLMASTFTYWVISPDTWNIFGTRDGNQGFKHTKEHFLSYIPSALFICLFQIYFLHMNVLSDVST